MKKSQRLKQSLETSYRQYYIISFLPNTDGGRVVVSAGVVKLVELEFILLMEEVKENDCGDGVSNIENLKKKKKFHVFFSP